MMGIGGFGMVWMLLFWVGLIVVAVWLVALQFPSTKTQDTGRNDLSPSAPEILRERYARGELSTDQYKEMLKTIEQ